MEMTPEDLRESVRDFRAGDTTEQDREAIRQMWAKLNIPNQFAAMARAADMEKNK